jgi:hypothetical protein
MAKKKENWPPKHKAGKGPDNFPSGLPYVGPAGQTKSLFEQLMELPGLNRELAQRLVEDKSWPAEAGELARKYGLAQMDAETILKVLNVNRGDQ